ncbi:MAG: CDP-glycerol glycerophosphotransferase family protein [Ruminococcaceae bacterium]|nr:CDP-glycerol glycerophosphotransferase family protein [Oscillospiraceae bacterium]
MKIIASLLVLGLRMVYFFFKLFLKPHKKITLLSRQSDTVTVDFELLNSALKTQGFEGKVKILCKKIPSGLVGKGLYAFHILSQMYHIATSNVIVVDGYSIAVCMLNHKPGQKVVQLWHALNIVKKFGHQALDKPWGHKSSTAKALCMHRNYDYIVACSPHSAQVLAKCFGTAVEKTVLLPLPRIDYILNSPEKREQIAESYPDIFKKPILIYAPTFRGQMVDLSWIAQTIDLQKYNVVVKLHPSDKFGIDESVDERVICDSAFSSFDWMKICNGIITDYSGMGFEAMLLEKKVYFYLYDYDEYSKNNGLNLDLFSEKVSEVTTKESAKLKQMLENEYDFSLTKDYVNKYLSVGTKDCAKRLADFIKNLV